jgi:hypothetical protein
MDESLWRLTWALPLVLVLGIVAMLALRRILQGATGKAVASGDAMVLKQSLKLSDSSTAHLLIVQGKPMLVVEGSHGVSSIELSSAAARRMPESLGARWTLPGVLR